MDFAITLLADSIDISSDQGFANMLGKQLIARAIIAVAIAVLSSSGLNQAGAAEPSIITNSIGMKLVEVPAGEFLMGAEEEQEETLKMFPYLVDTKLLDGEVPQHKVRITKSFYMGQYEVTLNEFLKFYRDAKYKLEAERDGKTSWGYENGKFVRSNRFLPWKPIAWKIEQDHPAIYLTWNDAVAFCEWLSKKEGHTYRLPTEAEWEYACRAGTNSRYSFGDDPKDLIRYANVRDDSLRTTLFRDATDIGFRSTFLSRSDGYAWTAPVGKYLPNAFGLYDMHGNAWEWCSDWHDKDYYKSSPEEDPQGPSTGLMRVLRGGRFRGDLASARCAYRDQDSPSSRNCDYGFRVVRVK